MFKKFFFIVVLMLSVLYNLKAEEVSKDKALSLAKSFFAINDPLLTKGTEPQLKLVLETCGTQTKGETEPSLYIFNRTDKDGFVIVSGESATSPVLGYSTTRPFKTENMPANVQYWIQGMADEINYIRSEGITQSPYFAQQWSNGSPDFGEVIIQYETAKWDQGFPYNKYCPTINGVQSVTGCTSTALAIVLKSRKWPDCGVGTVPSYTYDYNGQSITVPERVLGHVYDWNKMPDKLTARSSEEEIHQVATLMKDCGMFARANYRENETSSGIDLSKMPDGFRDHMKFSENVSLIRRWEHSLSSWYQALRKELSENGPLYYNGQTWGGGHSFVLDGFTSKDYFSVNWGWSGYCDGYYLLSALSPSELGTGGDGRPYNVYQCAMVGLKKAVTIEEPELPSVTLVYKRGNVDYLDEYRLTCGLLADTRNIRPKIPFKLHSGLVRNFSPDIKEQDMVEPFSGSLRYMLLNKDGVVKELLGEEMEYKDYSLSFVMFEESNEYVINSDIEETDYIELYYKLKSDSSWRRVEGQQGCNSRINLAPNTMVIYDDQVMLYDDYGAPGEGHIFDVPDSIIENQEFRLSSGDMICVYGNFTADFAYAVFDKNGEFKENIVIDHGVGNTEHFKDWEYSRGYCSRFEYTRCMITKPINEGDYIACAYRKTGETQWREIYGPSYARTKVPLTPTKSTSSLSDAAFDYSRASGMITITTQQNVEYHMMDAVGNMVSNGSSTSSGIIKIDTSSMSSGEYVLTMKNNKEEISLSLTL